METDSIDCVERMPNGKTLTKAGETDAESDALQEGAILQQVCSLSRIVRHQMFVVVFFVCKATTKVMVPSLLSAFFPSWISLRSGSKRVFSTPLRSSI